MAVYRYQVTHWRPDGPDRNRTIDLLKGPTMAEMPPAAVASMIDQGHTFYVASATYGDITLESVAGLPGRPKHVRTSPNGVFDDNLYALPKF